MSLAHGTRFVTPSLQFLARSVVWDMQLHEMNKVFSDFMLAVPFLEVGLVKRVSRGDKVVFANACSDVVS